MRRIAARLLLLAACACPAAATAQVAARFPAQLPDSMARHVIEFYNRPGTIRLSGDALIPAATTLDGALAVLGGRLTLGGTVRGDVVVINGDLNVEPGGAVTGGVVVVGGAITGDRSGLASTTAEFIEPLEYRQEGSLIVRHERHTAGRAPPAALRGGHDLGFGTARFYVAASGGYNRVEGLPLEVGPQLRLGGSNPTVLSALAIYRTAAGLRLDPDRLGHAVTAEQYLGGRRRSSLGARLFSEIVPIETAGLSTIENSFATFVLHRDYRDYYERRGLTGFARWSSADGSYSAMAEYRDERHAAVPPAQPWSLFGHQNEWRRQPAAAPGSLRALAGRLAYDTRNDPEHPSDGWLVSGEVEQAVGGTLFRPRSTEDSRPADPLPRFRRGMIDARRYTRISPWASLALRIATGGTLDAGELPPQRQHALGGDGSLPGFAHFSFDCGARNAAIVGPDALYHPYYGCDRMALVQLEYQANFPFGRRLSERIGPLRTFDQSVRWAAFFDSGRAWTEPSARGERQGGRDFSANAGLGLRFGAIGLYVAVPVSGAGKDYNVFLRLGPRF